MAEKCEKLYLTDLGDVSKNPPKNKYVKIYKDEIDGAKPVKKRRKKTEKMTIDKLAKIVDAGFKRVDDNFKQVNDRIDRIEKRLDYNELKPLPDRK